MTQWDFQNKGTLTSPARLFFVLKVPLRHLRPSVIYSVPCDQILQRAYFDPMQLCLFSVASTFIVFALKTPLILTIYGHVEGNLNFFNYL